MDLRVTLVAPGYPPERLGGAEIHALRLKEALERMGVSVQALTPRDRLPDPRPGAVLHLHAASVTLLPVVARLSRGWVPVITLHDVSFACPQLFFSRATGEACNARDARRCAVCMHRSLFSARIFYPLRRLGVAPLPGGAMKRLRDWLAWRKALRTLHRQGAWFVFPSAYVRRKFQELVGESPRGKVLPNPPGVTPRSPRPADPPRIFGWMGSASPGKGVDLLLEAWARCGVSHYPGGKLFLWGEPAPGWRTWWENLLRRYGEIRGVVWRGRFPPGAVERVLEEMDVLVLPSRVAENCPLSVVDALALGRRVLGSSRGGLPELLPPEALFPPTVAGVCAALERAETLRPPGLPAAVPDSAKYVQEMVQLYREVAFRA